MEGAEIGNFKILEREMVLESTVFNVVQPG